MCACTRVLQPLYHLCGTDVQSRFGCGARLLTANVYGRTILKDEARLWLKFISCQLVRKCGHRCPFFGQISRDIPQQVFRLLANVARNLEGFVLPSVATATQNHVSDSVYFNLAGQRVANPSLMSIPIGK